jgi:transcription elongation factor Elf1
MDVTVELHCDKCGSANLSLPVDGDEQATIECNDCGERHGTLAELRSELLACAMEHSAQALRSGLDRLP